VLFGEEMKATRKSNNFVDALRNNIRRWLTKTKWRYANDPQLMKDFFARIPWSLGLVMHTYYQGAGTK
jgi:hypothetical protein